MLELLSQSAGDFYTLYASALYVVCPSAVVSKCFRSSIIPLTADYGISGREEISQTGLW